MISVCSLGSQVGASETALWSLNPWSGHTALFPIRIPDCCYLGLPRAVTPKFEIHNSTSTASLHSSCVSQIALQDPNKVCSLTTGFPGGSVVKNLFAVQETQETWVQTLGWEDPLEKEMATHSSILARKIPGTEEPGRLPSMGLQRVGHDRSNWTHWAKRRRRSGPLPCMTLWLHAQIPPKSSQLPTSHSLGRRMVSFLSPLSKSWLSVSCSSLEFLFQVYWDIIDT